MRIYRRLQNLVVLFVGFNAMTFSHFIYANKTLKNLALFHCAKELHKISKMISPDSGKIFERDQIIFSSTELDLKLGNKKKRVKRLLVFTETGAFEYNLPDQGIANLMINVPNADPRLKARTYFIRYYHSNVTSNRTFGFSTWAQPNNTTDLVFQQAQPILAGLTDLNERMLYSINDQLEEIISNVQLGYISADDLLAGNTSVCKGILPEYKRVVALLNHKLNKISLMSPKGIRVRPKGFRYKTLDPIDATSSKRWPASQ